MIYLAVLEGRWTGEAIDRRFMYPNSAENTPANGIAARPRMAKRKIAKVDRSRVWMV